MDGFMDKQNVNETFRKRSRLGWLPGDKDPVPDNGSPCQDCDYTQTCNRICDKLRAAIDNALGKGYAEKEIDGVVIIRPEKGTTLNFSSMPEGRDIENREYGVEFNTAGLNFNMTTIFIEYFFKRRPLADIADDLGANEGTVHTYFVRAVEKIERIICILDARESAVKGLGKNANFNKYTEAEKAWLLSAILGSRWKK
jgi:hypothetical protein